MSQPQRPTRSTLCW